MVEGAPSIVGAAERDGLRSDAPHGAPPRGKRLPWWTDLGVLVAVWSAYTVARLAVSDDADRAKDNARALLQLEQLLFLDPELALVQWVHAHKVVALLTCYAYATLHYIVTAAVLVWVRVRRPQVFSYARDTLVIATLIALVCYWLVPMAPPRLIGDGFIDVMASYADFGWWGTHASAPPGTAPWTNEFAAFPSMHVGWAVWCGWVLWGSSRPAVRVLGLAYPCFVTFVVVATGNHFLLDAVAGAAVVWLAARVARTWHRDHSVAPVRTLRMASSSAD